MKNMKSTALNVLKNAILLTAKKEANSACLCIAYQPKMPKNVKELSNIK